MNRSAVSVARFLIGVASAAPVAFAHATPSPLTKAEAFAAADAYVCSDPSLTMAATRKLTSIEPGTFGVTMSSYASSSEALTGTSIAQPVARMPEVYRSCGVILFCSDADARGIDESRWA
jgi:hypothetical protein